MSRLFFTTPIPPSVNNYLDWKVERRGRKVIPKSYHSPDTVKYIADATEIINAAVKEQCWKPLDKDEWCKVTLRFYFPKKGYDSHNHNKVIFDVMTHLGIWLDDQFVMVQDDDVFVDNVHPRMEVLVETIDKIGVFQNEKELQDFKKNNCEHCRKNGRRCRFMTQFLENRAMSIDIDSQECLQKQ